MSKSSTSDNPVTQPKRSGGGTSRSGSNLPPRRSGGGVSPALMIGILIALGACALIVFLLLPGGDDNGPESPEALPPSGEQPGEIEERDPVIFVENAGLTTVCALYISASTADDWGLNRLPSNDDLEASETYEVFVSPGTYDMQAVNCAGTVLNEQFEVPAQLNEELVWVIGDEEAVIKDASDEGSGITLFNGSDTEVCYVFISESGADSWGTDRLSSSDTVDTGDEHLFVLEPGFYDMQALDCSEEVISEQFDVVVDPGLQYEWEIE